MQPKRGSQRGLLYRKEPAALTGRNVWWWQYGHNPRCLGTAGNKISLADSHAESLNLTTNDNYSRFHLH